MAGRPAGENITGKVYGRLTVLWDDGRVCEVRCTCGKKKVVKRGNLTHGHSTSCGCLRKELAIQRGRDNLGKKKQKKELVINDPTKL